MEAPNLYKEIEVGARSKAILENETFKDAVKVVQDGIFGQFAQTDPKDIAQLQVHRLSLKALADIVRHLQSAMDSGQMAVIQVEQERQAQTLREKAQGIVSRFTRRA